MRSTANKWLVTQSIFDLIRMGFIVGVLGFGNTNTESRHSARLATAILEYTLVGATLLSLIDLCRHSRDGLVKHVHFLNAMMAIFSVIGASLLISDLDDNTDRPEIGMVFIALSISLSKFKDLMFTTGVEQGGFASTVSIAGNVADGNTIGSIVNRYIFCPCPGSSITVMEPIPQGLPQVNR